MLRIRIELLPYGHEKWRATVAHATIANMGGNDEVGHYSVTFEEKQRDGFIEKFVSRVESFERLEKGPWELLYRALHQVYGRKAAKGTNDEEADTR
jgi:hypothetical protein